MTATSEQELLLIGETWAPAIAGTVRDVLDPASGEVIAQVADELARLETRDQGQPLSISAGFSVPMAAEVFRYYAGWCTKIESTAGPVTMPDVLHYTRREPVGVAALITPWNFPLMIAAWKL